MSTYSNVWDLETIYEGGSHSSEMHQDLERLRKELPLLKLQVEQMSLDAPIDDWEKKIDSFQLLGSTYSELSSFLSCLVSSDVTDEKAKVVLGSITELGALFDAVQNSLESKISEIPEGEWGTLKGSSKLKPMLFTLEEMRKRFKDKMSVPKEELQGDLSIDGYHGWAEMYNAIVGKMHVTVKEDEGSKVYSMGQLSNKLVSENRSERLNMFKVWEEAWSENADLFACVINHIAGYRLQLYKHRKWDSILKEPLDQNRMQKETLDAMWGVIQKNKEKIVSYMNRKAKMLGVDKLSWVDVQAPLPGSSQIVPFDEGAHFIIDQFHRFDPKMAAFARLAFEKRWIEAEDRPKKRPGGFMTSFPKSGESRIFMTYSGTPKCISTLAHELGHAYHTYVMRDLPLFSQQYAMNVAETASTFAELIVQDAAIHQATSKKLKITLLADKIESAISFFMDIHSRFLFETRLYEVRKDGLLSVDQLCTLMVQAQKEGFKNSLGQYNPYFWASKLHFYGTDVPFYNFPYSFGFLFSAGIYAKAKEVGKDFSHSYVNLLRDTARMTVEDLAQKHLEVDVRREDFWEKAAKMVSNDIDEFLSLTKKNVN